MQEFLVCLESLLLVWLPFFLWLFYLRIAADGDEFWTSYDEVYDSFDAMGLAENLLRGIYAYGEFNLLFSIFFFMSLAFRPGKYCYSLSWTSLFTSLFFTFHIY